ncbi:hypothetical protein Avbf_09385 [Armadillidium vulgare]|nr:hypothetical protein Avbf_09385 [Armadillidium vulgare]
MSFIMDSKKEIYDNLSKNAYDNGRIDKTFEEDSKLEETQNPKFSQIIYVKEESGSIHIIHLIF